jgi:AraC-like DNA-binding protein
MPGCDWYYPFVKQDRAARWQKRSLKVLTSEVVARPSKGPLPPEQWQQSFRELIKASKSPELGPAWWTPKNAYFGSVETRLDPTTYHWDGMKRLREGEQPLFFFQFTLAGWGYFEPYGKAPQRIEPGTAFFAVVPSRHRYYLPEASPGWTFGWLGIYHPYLLERVTKQVAATGAIFPIEPASPLVASATRLVRGAFRKDFRDRFEVELALFELVIAYERLAHQQSDPQGERERLLEMVRKRVVADLKRAPSVDALASEHGMTRSHFSHFFRARTGLTPARFVAETRIREAARMLVQDRASLAHVASACGFANANHFSRVFRRYQHLTPGAFRNAIG